MDNVEGLYCQHADRGKEIERGGSKEVQVTPSGSGYTLSLQGRVGGRLAAA